MNLQPTFLILTFFGLSEMAVSSKLRKPDNYESRISLKLSFTNIRSLRSNFVGSVSFLESIFPDIFTLWEANLEDWINSYNLFVGLIFL